MSSDGPTPGSSVKGVRLFEELSRTAPEEVLFATDLHAGNVLRSKREPWLVIDPKPFVGDPAYDATQHLLNCRGRLRADPDGTIGRFADLLEVDRERVRLWLFARATAEPRDDWSVCPSWQCDLAENDRSARSGRGGKVTGLAPPCAMREDCKCDRFLRIRVNTELGSRPDPAIRQKGRDLRH